MEILPQLIANSLVSGSIYALATAGLALTYGLLRILNFAHGHMLMLGSYFFFLFYIQMGLGFVSAVGLTAGAALVSGTLIMLVFIIPFSGYSYILPFITTLTLGTILESVVSLFFGVNVRSLGKDVAITSHEILGAFVTPAQIVVIVSAISLLSILAFIIHSTALGRMIRALAESPNYAQSIGIPKRTLQIGVFCLATALAFYAGVLVGFETNLQPTMGGNYTIKAFAAMILGGLGNIWGAVAGSYILGVLENFAIGIDLGDYSIPAGYKDAFAYSIILFMLLFKPRGLFSGAHRKA